MAFKRKIIVVDLLSLLAFSCLLSLTGEGYQKALIKSPHILLTQAAMPESFFNDVDGIIYNLQPSTVYQLYFNSTDYLSFTSDAKGEISVFEHQELLGKEIEGLVIPADMVVNDEDSAEQYCFYQIPSAIEETPTAYFTPETGLLSSLVKDSSYRLSFLEGDDYEITSSTNGDYYLSGDSKTVGKTLTSLVKIGDGTSTISSAPISINKKILSPGQVLSSFSQEGGYIYGLYANASYQLITSENNTINKVADIHGTIYADEEIYGKTINKIKLISDSSTYTYAESAQTLNYLFLSGREETPSSAAFAQESDLLSGLKSNLTYVLTFDDFSSYEFQTGTEESFSLADIEAIKGKTLSNLKLKGDYALKSDSLPFYLSGVILPKMALPAPNIDKVNGKISSLENNIFYRLLDGDKTSYDIQADSEGTIEIIKHPELLGKNLTSIQALKNGDTINSDPKVISYQVASKIEEKPTAIYNKDSGALTGLTSLSAYAVIFSDLSEKDIQADEQGTFYLTSSFSFLGKRLSGLKKKGDGINSITSQVQSFSNELIAIQYLTPEAEYTNGFISGLNSEKTYEVTFDDSSSVILKTDVNGYIFPWLEASLSGKTIVSIMQKGDDLKYINSPKQDGLNWLIPSLKENTPQTSFDKEKGTLNGLEKDASYLLIFSDGTLFNLNATASQEDLASLSQLAGKTLIGLVKVGDSKNTANSFMESLNSAILPHEKMPEATFQAPYLTNLSGNSNYILSFSDGTDLTYKASPKGTINTSENVSFYDKTLVGISKKGNDTSSIDSLKQQVNFVLPKREKAPSEQSLSFDKTTDILSGLEESSSYLLTFSDQSITTIKTKDGETTINLSSYAERTLVSIAKVGNGITTVTSTSTPLMIKIPVLQTKTNETSINTVTIILLSCLLGLIVLYIALFFIWKKTKIKLPKFLELSYRSISKAFSKEKERENQ
ncbi:MAG: hypothetical protein LKJ88_00555 [Bacilli bacterium]|jgi:hypothetical protein|nr:hypothetical protein [Bacilli bacterium]